MIFLEAHISGWLPKNQREIYLTEIDAHLKVIFSKKITRNDFPVYSYELNEASLVGGVSGWIFFCLIILSNNVWMTCILF